MPSLASDLRKTLENTVVKARDKAEGGARDALTALAVDASEPFGSMSEQERKLRNRLRARGRQLGDQRDAQKATQGIERLVREMAYEHWHRMLFARFLAENQLLIEPSSGVSISLDECEELAAEEGTDLWGLAAQYAQSMLPQIFRGDDPVLAAKLPLEIRQQLQGLVAGLAEEVFTASDSLGWTYQFWQTKRKKEVNESGVKIGADELSPVTQLFTEDYMVDFLLDNTLGAWYAGKVLAGNPQLAETAKSEEELRQAVALPGCLWSYLRFVKSDDGVWTPAAGIFEGWPNTAAELKCLDPCMGSGHFVVAMFERLVALRITEQGLSEQEAVAAVIESNLFGLEIDPRCTQIAAFNLALAAWRRLGHCALPAMNLACSGLAPNTPESKWLELAGDDERQRSGMTYLYRLFGKGELLGSLINPRARDSDLLMAGFNELKPLLDEALATEDPDYASHELAVTASGLTRAAEILSGQFNLVATNFPFLGLEKQGPELGDHLKEEFEIAKRELATSFLVRSSHFCGKKGASAVVMPGEWTYARPHRHFRKWLLGICDLKILSPLGSSAFATSLRAKPVLLVAGWNNSAKQTMLIDIRDHKFEDKPSGCAEDPIALVGRSTWLNSPDNRLVSDEDFANANQRLSDYADAKLGVGAGDGPRFEKLFWELPRINKDWSPLLGPSPDNQEYYGREAIIYWQQEKGEIFKLAQSVKHLNHAAQNWQRGRPFWGRRGLLLSQMGGFTLYTGEIFDGSCLVIMPRDESTLLALSAYALSGALKEAIGKYEDVFRIASPQSVLSAPFDLTYWQEVAAEKYPDGIPKPFSNDPTQWLFNGHPARSHLPLHVGVARLVGYLWPRQTGSGFFDCPALEPDGLEPLADHDGIVCLSPIRGEMAAADRLRGLLAATFGEEWSNAKERELLLETAVANNIKKPSSDLGDWIRQSFFMEHCKLFNSRPFIWQIWDGNPQGFNALVNYHKLAGPKGQGRKTLELLTYTYLGDWIDRQKLDQAEGVNGADDRLAAALDLQGQLKKLLDGEPPYDIFVRWKPLHQQAIGWDPDINDGVRLNIRPFLIAKLRKGGKAGAGILRVKPGAIKWTKDRGKEPFGSKDDFPWFWGWDENSPALATDFGAPVPGAPPGGDNFDGNRWNDLHYSRAAKEAARARHRGEG